MRPTYVAMARATAERALASGRLRPQPAEPLLDILADDQEPCVTATAPPDAAPVTAGRPVVARTRDELQAARRAARPRGTSPW